MQGALQKSQLITTGFIVCIFEEFFPLSPLITFVSGHHRISCPRRSGISCYATCFLRALPAHAHPTRHPLHHHPLGPSRRLTPTNLHQARCRGLGTRGMPKTPPSTPSLLVPPRLTNSSSAPSDFSPSSTATSAPPPQPPPSKPSPATPCA